MHSFDKKWLFPNNLSEAKIAQGEMSEKVLSSDILKPVQYIAGVDISNNPFDPAQMIFAAIVILSYPSLEVQESVTTSFKQEFPYIPGFLGFREVPALMQAYDQLSILPDLIMVDGHGISHPRGLGIASHLGVLLDVPTIGVAKSILVGKPLEPVSDIPGSEVPLLWKEKEIGRVVRTKKRSSPLIISTGHKISLKTAIYWVKCCLKGYKLPEPTRRAHVAANVYRKNFSIASTTNLS